MGKRKRKKGSVYRYAMIDKVTRWHACQTIAQFLYRSDLENEEIVNALAKMSEPPDLVSTFREITQKLETPLPIIDERS